MTAFLPAWRAFDASHSIRMLSGNAGAGRVVALLMTPSFAGGQEAANLALRVASRWAENGARVLLADGCLGNPRLHRGLGRNTGRGLGELLSSGGDPEEFALPGGVAGLKVLPAGGRPLLERAELLMSWKALCAACVAQGFTLALFAPADSDLGRWAVASSTDIVLLGRKGETAGPFLAPDEDRVRAVLGPEEEVAPRAVSEVLELPLETAVPAEPEGPPPMISPDARPAEPRVDPRPEGAFPPVPPASRPVDAETPARPDPWAEAAARLRAAAASSPAASAKPPPPEFIELPLVEQSIIESPPPLPPRRVRDAKVRWSVGPMFKGRGLGWTLAATALVVLFTVFWPGRRDVRPISSEPAPQPAAQERPGAGEPGPGVAGGDDPVDAPALPDTSDRTGDAAPPQAEPDVTPPAPPTVAPTVAAPSPATRDTAAAPASIRQDSPPTAATAVPAAPAAEATRHMRFSIGLAALSELQTAVEWTRALETRSPGQTFMVVPVDVNGTVYFRVLAGLLESSDQVPAAIRSLRSSTGEEGAGWLVREAPLAFPLGDFGALAQARARVAQLLEGGIPSYVLAVDRPDGLVYRVYAGGFAAPAEAAHLGRLLRRAGIDATLVERTGRAAR
jgi:hypothetical protein